LILFLSFLAGPVSSRTLSLNRINVVRLSHQGQATVVEIAGERAPNFTTFKQMAPRRVIVDVAECDLDGVPPSIAGDGKIVEKITTARYGRAPNVMSRVIIRLTQEAEYKVTIRGGTLLVHLVPGAGGLLVSAGVPVGPDRKLRKKTVVMNTRSVSSDGAVISRDEALSEELSESRAFPHRVRSRAMKRPGHRPGQKRTLSRARVGNLGAPQESLQVDSVSLPDPAADAELEGDEAEPDLVLVATRTPEPSRSPLHQPKPRPVSVPAEPGPGPDTETESESIRNVAPPPSPAPASIDALRPEPENSVEVSMAQEEAADEVPVEVVEEVEEISTPAGGEAVPPPVAPGEVEEPPPPPLPEEYVEREPHAPADERVEISSAIKNMTWVGFQQTRDSSRVFIKTNEPVKFHVVEEGRNLIVLELENTRVPLSNNTRFLDTHFFDSAVTMVVPREIEGISRNVRVEIQLRNRVPYTSGQEGNLVYVNFQRNQ
jgi:hypothetical protein